MAQTSVDEVFRDFNTPGNPGSGEYQPEKPRIRALLKQIQNSGGLAVTRNTYAALSGVTPPTENYMGIVLNDPDPTKNGYYARVASAWVWQRGFPDSVAVLTDIGGTANAITASTAAGVDPSTVQMLLLPDPPGTNTSATVTIALNGGSAENIRAASGAALAIGDIIAGVGTLFFRFGSEWRQLFSSRTGATFDHQGTYASGTTYTEGQVVTGSDGNWYQLKAASATGDDPVSGGSGDWLKILIGAVIADGSITRAKMAAPVSASVLYSVIERGAAGDGTTDDAAAIDAAQALGPLYFTPGEYRIETDLEITAPATFEPGAQITVATGVTLTLSGEIFAGAYKIFEVEGTGAITADTTASALSEIKAAWFDDTYVGDTVIARGRYAAHGVLGNPGLVPGFDYVHVDGFMACRDTTQGTEGLAIGTYAAAAATMMRGNTFVGYSAGRGEQVSGLEFRSWTGENNTGLGSGALNDILDADSNTAVGAYALKEFETGSGVIAVGSNASRLGTDKQQSVFIGNSAGYNVGSSGVLADSSDTVAIGHTALQNATQSYRNTVVGASAGAGIVTGTENIAIGRLAGPASSYGTVSKSIAVGNTTVTRADNTVTIGHGLTETVAGRIRIGGSDQSSAMIAGIYGSTTATAANVAVDSSGVLQRSTSSLEFKKDIEPLTDEWANKVLDLEPIYYRSKCEADNPTWGWYGLIAEDAAKVDPRFATWAKKPVTEDGKPVVDDLGQQVLEDEPTPNGVPYDRLVVSLLAVVKRQSSEILDLSQRMSELEKRK